MQSGGDRPIERPERLQPDIAGVIGQRFGPALLAATGPGGNRTSGARR